jgi:RND family efflux transporter MFP subunit
MEDAPDEAAVEAAESQLKAAELQLKAAELAVTETQKQLDEAVITAPFDGEVASVHAEEGDIYSPTGMPVIHLIDLTSMELEVEVDEIDVAEVKPGQRAIIEVDALPALQLEGEVASISLLSKKLGGLVLYEVTIGFDVPQGYNLKIGMSAIADIIFEERNYVLLVPNRAITQDSQGNPVVKVMVDEEIEERPVVTGISNGFDTEIVGGLNEGDVVVIETKVKPSAPGLF